MSASDGDQRQLPSDLFGFWKTKETSGPAALDSSSTSLNNSVGGGGGRSYDTTTREHQDDERLTRASFQQQEPFESKNNNDNNDNIMDQSTTSRSSNSSGIGRARARLLKDSMSYSNDHSFLSNNISTDELSLSLTGLHQNNNNSNSNSSGSFQTAVDHSMEDGSSPRRNNHKKPPISSSSSSSSSRVQSLAARFSEDNSNRNHAATHEQPAKPQQPKSVLANSIGDSHDNVEATWNSRTDSSRQGDHSSSSSLESPAGSPAKRRGLPPHNNNNNHHHPRKSTFVSAATSSIGDSKDNIEATWSSRSNDSSKQHDPSSSTSMMESTNISSGGGGGGNERMMVVNPVDISGSNSNSNSSSRGGGLLGSGDVFVCESIVSRRRAQFLGGAASTRVGAAAHLSPKNDESDPAVNSSMEDSIASTSFAYDGRKDDNDDEMMVVVDDVHNTSIESRRSRSSLSSHADSISIKISNRSMDSHRSKLSNTHNNNNNNRSVNSSSKNNRSMDSSSGSFSTAGRLDDLQAAASQVEQRGGPPEKEDEKKDSFEYCQDDAPSNDTTLKDDYNYKSPNKLRKQGGRAAGATKHGYYSTPKHWSSPASTQQYSSRFQSTPSTVAETPSPISKGGNSRVVTEQDDDDGDDDAVVVVNRSFEECFASEVGAPDLDLTSIHSDGASSMEHHLTVDEDPVNQLNTSQDSGIIAADQLNASRDFDQLNTSRDSANRQLNRSQDSGTSCRMNTSQDSELNQSGSHGSDYYNRSGDSEGMLARVVSAADQALLTEEPEEFHHHDYEGLQYETFEKRGQHQHSASVGAGNPPSGYPYTPAPSSYPYTPSRVYAEETGTYVHSNMDTPGKPQLSQRQLDLIAKGQTPLRSNQQYYPSKQQQQQHAKTRVSFDEESRSSRRTKGSKSSRCRSRSSKHRERPEDLLEHRAVSFDSDHDSMSTGGNSVETAGNRMHNFLMSTLLDLVGSLDEEMDDHMDHTDDFSDYSGDGSSTVDTRGSFPNLGRARNNKTVETTANHKRARKKSGRKSKVRAPADDEALFPKLQEWWQQELINGLVEEDAGKNESKSNDPKKEDGKKSSYSFPNVEKMLNLELKKAVSGEGVQVFGEEEGADEQSKSSQHSFESMKRDWLASVMQVAEAAQGDTLCGANDGNSIPNRTEVIASSISSLKKIETLRLLLTHFQEGRNKDTEKAHVDRTQETRESEFELDLHGTPKQTVDETDQESQPSPMFSSGFFSKEKSRSETPVSLPPELQALRSMLPAASVGPKARSEIVSPPPPDSKVSESFGTFDNSMLETSATSGDSRKPTSSLGEVSKHLESSSANDGEPDAWNKNLVEYMHSFQQSTVAASENAVAHFKSAKESSIDHLYSRSLPLPTEYPGDGDAMRNSIQESFEESCVKSDDAKEKTPMAEAPSVSFESTAAILDGLRMLEMSSSSAEGSLRADERGAGNIYSVGHGANCSTELSTRRDVEESFGENAKLTKATGCEQASHAEKSTTANIDNLHGSMNHSTESCVVNAEQSAATHAQSTKRSSITMGEKNSAGTGSEDPEAKLAEWSDYIYSDPPLVDASMDSEMSSHPEMVSFEKPDRTQDSTYSTAPNSIDVNVSDAGLNSVNASMLAHMAKFDSKYEGSAPSAGCQESSSSSIGHSDKLEVESAPKQYLEAVETKTIEHVSEKKRRFPRIRITTRRGTGSKYNHVPSPTESPLRSATEPSLLNLGTTPAIQDGRADSCLSPHDNAKLQQDNSELEFQESKIPPVKDAAPNPKKPYLSVPSQAPETNLTLLGEECVLHNSSMSMCNPETSEDPYGKGQDLVDAVPAILAVTNKASRLNESNLTQLGEEGVLTDVSKSEEILSAGEDPYGKRQDLAAILAATDKAPSLNESSLTQFGEECVLTDVSKSEELLSAGEDPYGKGQDLADAAPAILVATYKASLLNESSLTQFGEEGVLTEVNKSEELLLVRDDPYGKRQDLADAAPAILAATDKASLLNQSSLTQFGEEGVLTEVSKSEELSSAGEETVVQTESSRNSLSEYSDLPPKATPVNEPAAGSAHVAASKNFSKAAAQEDDDDEPEPPSPPPKLARHISESLFDVKSDVWEGFGDFSSQLFTPSKTNGGSSGRLHSLPRPQKTPSAKKINAPKIAPKRNVAESAQHSQNTLPKPKRKMHAKTAKPSKNPRENVSRLPKSDPKLDTSSYLQFAADSKRLSEQVKGAEDNVYVKSSPQPWSNEEGNQNAQPDEPVGCTEADSCLPSTKDGIKKSQKTSSSKLLNKIRKFNLTKLRQSASKRVLVGDDEVLAKEALIGSPAKQINEKYEQDVNSSDMQAIESHTTPSDVQAIKSHTMPLDVQAIESHTTSSDVQAIESHTPPLDVQAIESHMMPSDGQAIESHKTSSEMQAIESCTTSFDVQAIESHMTPSDMQAIESHTMPSDVQAIEFHMTPSNVQAIQSHMTSSDAVAAASVPSFSENQHIPRQPPLIGPFSPAARQPGLATAVDDLNESWIDFSGFVSNPFSFGDSEPIKKQPQPTKTKSPFGLPPRSRSRDRSSARKVGVVSTKSPPSSPKKSISSSRSVGEKSISSTQSVGEKSISSSQSLREKSFSSSRSVGEKPCSTSQSVGEKSCSTSQSVGEKSSSSSLKVGAISPGRPLSSSIRSVGAIACENSVLSSSKSVGSASSKRKKTKKTLSQKLSLTKTRMDTDNMSVKSSPLDVNRSSEWEDFSSPAGFNVGLKSITFAKKKSSRKSILIEI